MLFEHFGMSSEVLLHRDDVFPGGIAYGCIVVLECPVPLARGRTGLPAAGRRLISSREQS